jgi:hypothetical protein
MLTCCLVVEGQKCEPFSAPLHTIVPLRDGAGGGGPSEDEDEDDGGDDDYSCGGEVLDASITDSYGDSEDFAPRTLNLRWASACWG